MKLENGLARNRKQDLIFAILKNKAKNGKNYICIELEVLQDGFGFLRSPEANLSSRA